MIQESNYTIMKRINISITLVSQSYALLDYEKKAYMLFINKICLNQLYNLLW